MTTRLAALALTALALAPAPAFAATQLQGVAALHEWNLIVLGNVQSSSEVEGRTFIGGDLSGNSSNYQTRTPAPSSNGNPGLTVVGNVTGGTKNLNNGSGATIGGNVTSGFNLNGPVQTVNVGGTISSTNVNQNTVNSGLASTSGFLSALADQRDELISSLASLSQSLAGLAPTNTASIASNRATFDVTPDSQGLAVYSLNASDLDTFGEIQFNRNGADTVIVNVSGLAPVLNDNFLGSSSGLGANVIWNFADATTISLTTAWKGSILAPFANATTGNFIEGSAVFNNLVQNGEVHLGTYSGNYAPPVPTPPPSVDAVPEPATWAMLLLGFGFVGAAVRRRRGQPAAAVRYA